MKRLTLIKTASEAERERKRLKSVWSSETQLSQRILIRCMDLLQKIAENTGRKRKPRRASAYQKFIGEQMRRGLTAGAAAGLWREQREQAKSKAS